MNNREHLMKFISAKTCTFFLHDDSGSQQVTVEIPDLSLNSVKVWGDWGPMYSFALMEDQFIEVTYKNSNSYETSTNRLVPQYLQLFSPSVASDRDAYPFFFNIFDKKMRMAFHLYLDHEGRVARVDSINIDSGREAFISAVEEIKYETVV